MTEQNEAAAPHEEPTSTAVIRLGAQEMLDRSDSWARPAYPTEESELIDGLATALERVLATSTAAQITAGADLRAARQRADGVSEDAEREAEFTVSAHNLAVITYRVLGSRNITEAYEDDPVVHYLVDAGALAIASTLRPTPSDRDGRARGHAEFWQEVEKMQAPMRSRYLQEWNTAIEHMVRERQKIMAAAQYPVLSLDDQIIDERYAGLFNEEGVLVKPAAQVKISEEKP